MKQISHINFPIYVKLKARSLPAIYNFIRILKLKMNQRTKREPVQRFNVRITNLINNLKKTGNLKYNFLRIMLAWKI